MDRREILGLLVGGLATLLVSGIAGASDKSIEDAVVLQIRPAGAAEALCARVPTSNFKQRRHAVGSHRAAVSAGEFARMVVTAAKL